MLFTYPQVAGIFFNGFITGAIFCSWVMYFLVVVKDKR